MLFFRGIRLFYLFVYCLLQCIMYFLNLFNVNRRVGGGGVRLGIRTIVGICITCSFIFYKNYKKKCKYEYFFL